MKNLKRLEELRVGDFFLFADPLKKADTRNDVWRKVGRNCVTRGVIMCLCDALHFDQKRRYPGFLFVEVVPYSELKVKLEVL